MAAFKSRVSRGTFIIAGALLSCIVLYTAFLFHSQHTSNRSSVLTSKTCSYPQHPLILDIEAFRSIGGDVRATEVNQVPLSTTSGGAPETILPSETSSAGVGSSTSSSHVLGHSPLPKNPEPSASWTYYPAIHAKAYGLSSAQCDIAFPGLFAEIDRAAEYQKGVGMVTEKDTDISWKIEGAVKAMIVDQQLYILEAKIYHNPHDSMRALATLHAINRALITSPSSITDTIFSFSTSDIADDKHTRHIIWSLTRTEAEQEKWLMSDFGYWSWPLDLVGGYEQVRREIADTEIAFKDKRKQVVWRGAVKTNPLRKDLIKATRGKDWADVQSILWSNSTQIKEHDSVKALSIPEHCQYQFVLQTEGHSYSGRGKYLQNCNSVAIMHKRTFVEPHHALLVSSGPEQNFVEVENDFSDLESKVQELLRDPEKTERIARSGAQTFRDGVLTPAAQACYWRRMIQRWSEVSEIPRVWEGERDGNGRRTRGVPFETFAIQMAMPPIGDCSFWRKLTFQC